MGKSTISTGSFFFSYVKLPEGINKKNVELLELIHDADNIPLYSHYESQIADFFPHISVDISPWIQGLETRSTSRVEKLDGGTPADEWSHHQLMDEKPEFHSSQNLGFF